MSVSVSNFGLTGFAFPAATCVSPSLGIGSGLLTNSAAQIIAQLLIDLGLATAPADGDAWPVYFSSEPDRPDSVVTVYDTSGRLFGTDMPTGELNEALGVQVRVRCATHTAGWLKANAIAVALHEDVSFQVVTVGAVEYCVSDVNRIGGVVPLGTERGSKRNVFTANFTVTLRQRE